jgi:hypothetical protein
MIFHMIKMIFWSCRYQLMLFFSFPPSPASATLSPLLYQKPNTFNRIHVHATPHYMRLASAILRRRSASAILLECRRPFETWEPYLNFLASLKIGNFRCSRSLSASNSHGAYLRSLTFLCGGSAKDPRIGGGSAPPNDVEYGWPSKAVRVSKEVKDDCTAEFMKGLGADPAPSAASKQSIL